jgi:hypothetical protein
MGHGHEDERGVRRLGGRDGKQIAQDLKTLEGLTQHNSDTRLAKVSLMSCFGDTCGASGTSLAQDLKQGLNNEGVKIKGYRDGIDLDSRGHTKGVLHGGLVRDDKGTPNTKPQQQVNPPGSAVICFLDDDMAFVFDGGVCVFWVFCCWLSLVV